MSDNAIDPAAFKGLSDRVDKLASAMEGLAKAKTEPAKEKAEEKVESAEDALATYAKSHGITRDQAEEAMNEIQRKNRRSEIREAIKEFTSEDWDEIFPPGDDDGAAGGDGENGKSDTPPNPGEHWTEKRIFSR